MSDAPHFPDRRAFLKQSGRFLMLTGAAAIAWDSLLAGTPSAAPNYKTAEHLWAMMIDIDKCIGCGNCVRACKTENNVSLEAAYFRTWVERYHVKGFDFEHPDVDSPNGGYDGFPDLYPAGDGAKSFFVPKMCNHCSHSPCTQVCPVGATFESPDGVVLIDSSYCLGCRYCVQACPYGCRYIDPKTNTVDKCTLCYHRITKGLTTACCESCPTEARRLGDLKNPNDPIHAFLRDNDIQVLKPQMATGSKTYYKGLDGSVR
jgi:Fe-S-cluster-containing dehydrogenase component